MNVNLREVRTYISDDGRKIEVHSSCGKVDYNTDDKEEIEILNKIPESSFVFGFTYIKTNNGPREIRFHIPTDKDKSGDDLINQAFDKFVSVAKEFIKKIEEEQRDYINKLREQKDKIVTASANDLKMIEDGIARNGR